MADLGQSAQDLKIKVLQKEIEIEGKEAEIESVRRGKKNIELDRLLLDKRIEEGETRIRVLGDQIVSCKRDLESMKKALEVELTKGGEK